MITREFTFKKSTANTYVYEEERLTSEEPKLTRVIYVLKDALPTKPQRIRVTVEEVEPTT